MDNQELELKIKEIIANDNFFDMLLEVKKFDKEYKTSNFYKETKINLMDIIKEAKLWYSLNAKTITNSLQKVIDGLSFEKINDIINNFTKVFENENKQFFEDKEFLEDIKNLVK